MLGLSGLNVKAKRRHPRGWNSKGLYFLRFLKDLQVTGKMNMTRPGDGENPISKSILRQKSGLHAMRMMN
jgi:hypothetical protein